ncbi:protein of unknown function [Pseudodesulfovibrio profundus]|uniref:Uncharacterized protein n=1 Tax=Pseudodesulfovibrio profundus TaxID=57320 RepID=A0A2C8F2P3_9BACT|nr:hypothetical protein [Pseudodesulfovibrio profundus]SOB56973.1 protein of unknown function [Pseudodesulfovibrio profundus]
MENTNRATLKTLAAELKDIDQGTLKPAKLAEYVSRFFDTSIKDNKFALESIEELPTWFLIHAFVSVWPKTEKDRRSFLLNLLNAKLKGANYRDMKIELAAQLSACDPPSGLMLLTAVESNESKKGGELPKIYMETVEKHFFPGKAEPIASILNHEFKSAKNLKNVSLQFFEILFECKTPYGEANKLDLQAKLIEWLIVNGTLEHCTQKYPNTLTAAVSGWTIGMLPAVKAIMSKAQQSGVQLKLPLAGDEQTDSIPKQAPSEPKRSEALTADQLLDQLGKHLAANSETIRSQNNNISRLKKKLSKAKKDSSRRADKLQQLEEELLQSRQALRKERESHQSQLNEERTKLGRLQTEVTEKNTDIDGLKNKIRSLDEKIVAMKNDHSVQIQKTSDRFGIETEHACKEFKEKLKDSLRPEYRDMNRLGDSKEEEIAKIMLEGLFKKLNKLGINFS